MNLTDTQLAALKAAILADPVAAPMFTDGSLGGLADYFNAQASPAFIVWRSDVSAAAIGNAWVGTDIDGMSALNMQRLQLLLASSPAGYSLDKDGAYIQGQISYTEFQGL